MPETAGGGVSTDRYHVVWLHSVKRHARQVIDGLLARGEETKSFYQALARINLALTTNPEEKGESREYEERVISETPACVTFEVHSDTKDVIVLNVAYHKPKSDRN